MNINDFSIKQLNSPQVVMGTTLLLCLLTLSTAGFNIYQWREDWLLAHESAITEPAIGKSNSFADIVTAIPSEHLFGEATKLGNMPITNLQLQVTGIAKLDLEQGKSVSKAYISIAGQPSKIFKIGDNMPYGVKVHDITPDAVVLENDGHLEKLPLPRQTLEFKPKPTLELAQYD